MWLKIKWPTFENNDPWQLKKGFGCQTVGDWKKSFSNSIIGDWELLVSRLMDGVRKMSFGHHIKGN